MRDQGKKVFQEQMQVAEKQYSTWIGFLQHLLFEL